ncbi:MAG TPA: hypothetical protein PK447_06340 [Ignavibacteria bacterium]|nr:hypothetical protein [Ignavibacteria bacterium]
MKIYSTIILFLFPFGLSLCQQKLPENKHDFSISFGLNYISSASIQLNPFSSDIIERNTIEDVNGGYSYGISIKKRVLFDNFYISLSTEYISIKDNNNYETLSFDTSYINFGVKEELKVIPVETAVIYKLPEFFRNFEIYIGGGIGIYFGDRVRTLYRIQSSTVEKKINLNLNVLMGTEYYLSENVSAFFEMKFREGRYEVKSRYPSNTIVLDGIQYSFSPDLHSRIFIDGIRLSGGINYYFR